MSDSDWDMAHLVTTPQARQPARGTVIVDGRRDADRLMGERVARIEQRLTSIEGRQESHDQSIIRVHERLDALTPQLHDMMNARFGEFLSIINDQLATSTSHFDKSLRAHVDDEDKEMEAKFHRVDMSLHVMSGAIKDISEDGKKRGEEAQTKLQKLERMGWAATVTVLLGVIGGAGAIIAFLVQYGPTILRFIEKVEKLA